MKKINWKLVLFGKIKWWRIPLFFATLYLALVLFGCLYADNLIFHPPKKKYQAKDDIFLIPVTDKEKIAVTYLKNPNAEFTLLYSHGNAEDLGRMRGYFKAFVKHGFAVIAYDYRGYGLSDGKPSESNTYGDITAVYDYLTKTLKIPPEKIIVYGRSVGSGPSCYLAEHKKAAGLVIQSGFVSAFRVVTNIAIVPFDKFPNLSRMKNIKCPVLFIHGRRDRVVPFWHGEKLFNAANAPKMHYWVDLAGHNDLEPIAAENFWKALKDFTAIIRRGREKK